MGKRSNIDRRLRILTDISGILRVMRTLAIMETSKLSRFIDAQSGVVRSIEAVAADLLHFYPQVVAPGNGAMELLLLIGSERGFCGDFNETLLRTWEQRRVDTGGDQPLLLAVGSRLCVKMPADALDFSLPGACTVEEVQTIISQVVESLNELTAKRSGGSFHLTVLCHGGDGLVASRTLQPFHPDLIPVAHDSHPPLLNLPPQLLYSQLTGQYLFAALHEMFYQSLLIENQQRQRHIDSAARRMDQKIGDLNLKKNAVRQEEIIDEIETLMLSAEPEFQAG